jgi:hypothetical protein
MEVEIVKVDHSKETEKLAMAMKSSDSSSSSANSKD